MTKYLLSLVFCLVFINIQAQDLPAPCFNNEFDNANSCETACIICEPLHLRTFNNNQLFPPGPPPPGFCSSEILNSQWLGFVAGSTILNFEILVENCQQFAGLQFAVYDAVGNCANPELFICVPQIMPFQAQVITLENLMVGKSYYLVIDGFQNDICDFTITELTGTTGAFDISDQETEIFGPNEVCIGQEIDLSAGTVIGAGYYKWTLNGAPIDNEQTIFYLADVPGNYEFCVTPSNICSDAIQVCKTVFVPPIIPETIHETICEGDFYVFQGAIYDAPGVYTIQFVGPTGCLEEIILLLDVIPFSETYLIEEICEGEIIVIGGIPYQDPGFYTNVFTSTQGCDSLLYLELIVNPNDFTALDITVCEGDGVQVGNNYYDVSGAYETTLSNINGCDSTITLNLTVLAAEVAVINGQASACEGDFTVLDANIAAVYAWSTGENTQTIQIQVDTTTTYSVTTTDINGCNSTAEITVTALELPTITISEEILDCEEGTIILTANGAQDYSWSNGATTASITINPSNPETHSVTGTDFLGCVNEASILVEPIVLPNSPDISCIAFTNAIAFSWNQESNLSYEVEILSGQTGQVDSNTITIADLGLGEAASIQVTATDSAGCSSATSIECFSLSCDDPPTVNLEPIPPLCATSPPFSLIANISNSDGTGTGVWSGPGIIDSSQGIFDPASVDIGTSIITYVFEEGLCIIQEQLVIEIIDALETPVINCNAGFNSVEFSWNEVPNAESYSVEFNGTPAVNIGQNTSYSIDNLQPGEVVFFTLIVNPNTACDEVTAHFDCVTQTCEGFPEIEVTEDQIYCVAQTVQLEAFAENAVSYSWSPSTALSCTDCPSPFASPDITTTYTVTVENEYGCVNSAEVTLYQEEFPNFDLPNEINACFGQEFEFCLPDALGYEWTGPGFFVSDGQCLIIPEIDFIHAGIYSVQIAVSNACTLEHTMLIIYETPLEIISSQDTICKGESISLGSNYNNAQSWDWSPDESISCDNCPSVEVGPLQSTTLTLEVLTPLGCTYTDAYSLTIDSECLDDPTIPGNTPLDSLIGADPSRKGSGPVFSVQAEVFPNPAYRMLNVKIQGAEQATLQLFDLNGRMVLPGKAQDDLITKLSVNQLDAGVYFLKIVTEDEILSKKIIITK